MQVSIHTFGCKSNLYDSELIAKDLSVCTISENKLIADVHVINTCTVTKSADAQARNLIKKLETHNNNSLIVVLGCSVRNSDYQDFINTLKKNKIVIIDNFKESVSKYLLKYFNLESKTKILKFRTRAFVKIADGCNNYCSYCIIPFVRGRLRSRPINNIISEIKDLELNGCKELVLTAISIDAYEFGLKNLIESILKNTNEIRIRLSSIRPSSLNTEFINLFKEQRLRPHFHISLQSGSDKILKLMNRHDYTSSDFINITNNINKILKHRKPFVAADIIVGFPSEDDYCFNETLNTVNTSYITNLHVFKFSPRQKTKAFEMAKNTKFVNLKERSKIILDLAKRNYQNALSSMIGRKPEVLWETNTKGRTDNYFPIIGKGIKNTSENKIITDCSDKCLFC